MPENPGRLREMVRAVLSDELRYAPEQWAGSIRLPAPGGATVSVDEILLAPGGQRRLQDACLGIEFRSGPTGPPDAGRYASFGIPAVLVVGENVTQHWRLGSDRKFSLRAAFSTDRLATYVARHRDELTPYALLEEKRGEIRYDTLGASLLEYAEDQFYRSVGDRVQEFLSEGRRQRDRFLMLDLLRYLALRHRRASPASRPDPHGLGFTVGEVELGSLSGPMLVDLAVETERMFGTERPGVSRALARALLNRLPVAELTADRWRVLEISPGSGALLVAAYRRLNELSYTGPPTIRAFDLQAESVPMTIRAALDLEGADDIRALGRPAVTLEESHHLILADYRRGWTQGPIHLPFQGKCGLAAILWPLERLHALHGSLLEPSDLLEVWAVPREYLTEGDEETAVLIVRQAPAEWGARVRVFGAPERLPEVKRAVSRWSERYRVVEDPGPELLWHKSTAEEQWETILAKMARTSFFNLGDSAWAFRVPAPPRQTVRETSEGGAQPRPYMESAAQFLPFRIASGQGFVHLPAMRLSSYRWLDRPKLLVIDRPRTGTPWAVYGACDREGIFPRQGLLCVLPKFDSVELFTALINNPLISRWLIHRLGRRKHLLPSDLLAIPFPELDRRRERRIVQLVRSVETLCRRGGSLPKGAARLLREMDDLIFSAFDLTADEMAFVQTQFPMAGRLEKSRVRRGPSERATGPQAAPDFLWRVWGEVVGVGAGNERIHLQMEDWHDGETIETLPPPDMPGWAMRPGVRFEASLPFSLMLEQPELPYLPLTAFRPIPPLVEAVQEEDHD